MSLESIHLRQLLQIFYASDAKRKSFLRKDIRDEINKRNKVEPEGGGDFYGPFWADAKNHILGEVDLREQTKLRIEGNPRRRRLYTQLSDGFLKYHDEKRRSRNEEFKFLIKNVKARLSIHELGKTVVKVENLLSMKIIDQSDNATHDRIIYPYFSEDPALGKEGARIGLWLMNEALSDYRVEDMRILDVLRSTLHAVNDSPLKGNERDLFIQKYKSLLQERQKLRKEY